MVYLDYCHGKCNKKRLGFSQISYTLEPYTMGQKSPTSKKAETFISVSAFLICFLSCYCFQFIKYQYIDDCYDDTFDDIKRYNTC